MIKIFSIFLITVCCFVCFLVSNLWTFVSSLIIRYHSVIEGIHDSKMIAAPIDAAGHGVVFS